MREIVERCPNCGGSLVVTEARRRQCRQCRARMRPGASLGFETLTVEQAVFAAKQSWFMQGHRR